MNDMASMRKMRAESEVELPEFRGGESPDLGVFVAAGPVADDCFRGDKHLV